MENESASGLIRRRKCPRITSLIITTIYLAYWILIASLAFRSIHTLREVIESYIILSIIGLGIIHSILILTTLLFTGYKFWKCMQIYSWLIIILHMGLTLVLLGYLGKGIYHEHYRVKENDEGNLGEGLLIVSIFFLSVEMLLFNLATIPIIFLYTKKPLFDNHYALV